MAPSRHQIVSVPAVSEVQGEARAVWLRLREIFGDSVQFSPVLLDESAAPMVPTGQVTVLFREPTTPENVQRFAADHGLTLAPTRSWSPQQARFVLGTAPRFLPDVIEELRADPRALDAWPDVWLDVAFEGLSAR